MKLHLLQNLIDQFISAQLKSADNSWYYPHSLVDHFNKTWFRPDELHLKQRYDSALRSDISLRWWKRENYRPKEIMLKLIDTDPEIAIIAFKDLFNESATLDGRLSRFNFYMEDLLQLYRKTNSRDIETHHHQDASIISLYLAGSGPEKYSLYPGIESFQQFCRIVESPDIPVVNDLVRYNKIATIIFNFLQKHSGFEELYEKRTSSIHKVNFLPFQTTYEIIALGNIFKTNS